MASPVLPFLSIVEAKVNIRRINSDLDVFGEICPIAGKAIPNIALSNESDNNRPNVFREFQIIDETP